MSEAPGRNIMKCCLWAAGKRSGENPVDFLQGIALTGNSVKIKCCPLGGRKEEEMEREEKLKALDAALAQIEKQYGKAGTRWNSQRKNCGDIRTRIQR